MRNMAQHTLILFVSGVVLIGGWGGMAHAEEASESEPSAEEEFVERLGRVEMVLIENEDPESALEFGQELLGENGSSVRLRLLLASCLMQLNRAEEALEHLRQAARLTESGDDTAHLHALYNIGRAYHLAGQVNEAADAYDRYIAFARSHSTIPSHVEGAQRIVQTLRARLVAAAD